MRKARKRLIFPPSLLDFHRPDLLFQLCGLVFFGRPAQITVLGAEITKASGDLAGSRLVFRGRRHPKPTRSWGHLEVCRTGSGPRGSLEPLAPRPGRHYELPIWAAGNLQNLEAALMAFPPPRHFSVTITTWSRTKRLSRETSFCRSIPPNQQWKFQVWFPKSPTQNLGDPLQQ